MTAKDPRERPPSAAIAAEDLEELLLDLLGPRWRREARLPEPPSGRAASETADRPASESFEFKPAATGDGRVDADRGDRRRGHRAGHGRGVADRADARGAATPPPPPAATTPDAGR